MSSSLVIVESPTKAKTISKFLGSSYRVLSSFGHVRDLPKSKLGVDVEHNFEPKYLVPKEKSARVKELKAAAEKADEILFATDEDREGEAISWHLAELLDVPDAKVKRLVFHEITKRAIEQALEHSRPLDLNLVHAQQARRILDRLVGYELSPFLWRKVQRGLSAGRVQSVAMRFVVEREREREAFVPQDYWTVEAQLKKAETTFPAKLHAVDGKALDKLAIKSQAEAERLMNIARGGTWTVMSVGKKQTKRAPAPPFTTASLQQEANNRLGLTAAQTMRIAQKLYEGVDIPGEGHVGLITYMRTDSVNLSGEFLQEAKALIAQQFGEIYVLPAPRTFQTKSKGAQEAHEAIRPSDPRRLPEMLKDKMEKPMWKLYELIWRRAVATQMPEAIFDATSVDVEAGTTIFRATGSIRKFDGFTRVYPDRKKEVILPELAQGDVLTLEDLKSEAHQTEPAARYSDATLVKALEEFGIGRPSTYAPTIATIIDRGYVERDENKKLKPTDIARIVNDLLVEHFPNIVDFAFTADMEKQLDDVAEGKIGWVPVLKNFYGPFHETLEEKQKSVERVKQPEIPTSLSCDQCGKPFVIKNGRFGRFFACTGYPECKNTKAMVDQNNTTDPQIMQTNEICPTCGAPMEVKQGRFGDFLSCTKYPECKTIKKLVKSTGVTCPKCGKGEIVEKRTKTGRTFFSCNTYPACDFALWNRPSGTKCPACDSLMVQTARGEKCSAKGCKG